LKCTQPQIKASCAKNLAKRPQFKQVPGVIKSVEIINSKLIDHHVYRLDLESPSLNDLLVACFLVVVFVVIVALCFLACSDML